MGWGCCRMGLQIERMQEYEGSWGGGKDAPQFSVPAAEGVPVSWREGKM